MADTIPKQDKDMRSRMITGIILTGLGILFLLHNLDVIDFGESWPLILIVVGLSLLAGAFMGKKKPADDGLGGLGS